uniref:Uncharacterized protein n=1 Tax=Arundo donax TaxID=35708 RepID=A0A0A9H623_ARUDO
MIFFMMCVDLKVYILIISIDTFINISTNMISC